MSILQNAFVSVLLLSQLLLYLAFSAGAQPPTIMPPVFDGQWSEQEYPYSIRLKSEKGRFIDFAYRISENYVFLAARFDDSTPTLFAQDPREVRDYFSIGFDRNGDGVYMGTSTSPDDTIIVGMEGNFSDDFYMQGIKQKSVIRDTDKGGSNNTLGIFSLEVQTFTFEVRKELQSSDELGNDISLQYGDSVPVMIAYWDNLPVLTEITSFTDFYILRLVDPTDPSFSRPISFNDLVTGFTILGVSVVFTAYFFLSRKRSTLP